VPSLATWLDLPFDVHVNEPGTWQRDVDRRRHPLLSHERDVREHRAARDVVYHEFGHALHAHAFIPGVGAYNSSLSEGLSDFFAASIVDDQGVGRGFTFDDRPGCASSTPRGSSECGPKDRGTTAHQTGLIISGALWICARA